MGETRNRIINISLTPSEKTAIENKATEKGLKPSSYVRMIMLEEIKNE